MVYSPLLKNNFKKNKRLCWRQFIIYGEPRQHIKKQDITLPTKVHPVKAIVFLVVMYGCESWTIKKAEH